MSADQWTFPGRYGDDKETVTIQTMPNELTKALKRALRSLYKKDAGEFYECSIQFGAYALQELGLGRETGNAWHPKIMWAPQVHEWMGRKNTNASAARSLQRQYA